MAITPNTLKAMLSEFGGVVMTDAQLADAAGALETWMAEFRRLDELDLSVEFSANVLHPADGGFTS